MKKFITILLCMVLMVSVFATGCKEKESKEKNEKEKNTISQENDEQKEAKMIDYVLYLRHKEMPFLFDEAYSIKANDEKLKDKTVEEFVMNELMDCEGVGENINPIPKGTKLLSIEKNDKTVTINLSKEFSEGLTSDHNDTLLTLASIVNTMTIMPDNEKVQFMIEGEILDKMNGVDTNKPFEYMDAFYPDK
ncbi:GerMN domain-containing protein [Marinisporobacter balticus]|uniref:Sporulation and spore germination protein n=1 Tax=Marinisporobacter balticus TaxID=2018667 RepID=A0A4R2KRK8_9FIRM|nr:GerMN domain-containing protein [Marinisporobacter balticus]TCO73626.1 sporulation and spore germination protein [Marinisporobacter balticus]